MLAAVHEAVKSAAPELSVLASGLAFTLGDGVNAVNDLDYLRELFAAGAASTFDALAVHAYGFGRSPDEEPAPDRLNFRRLELHCAIMEASGAAAKPVWITEMGWRTAAPDPAESWQVVKPQQRDYTLAAIDRGASYPWLERMALWELTTGMDRYGYALWQGDGRTTPAYDALVARQGDSEQVDQPTNGVRINERWVGALRPRTQPDPTNTWVTQRIDLAPGVLHPGRNTLTVVSGARNPTRSFRWWRWENFVI